MIRHHTSRRLGLAWLTLLFAPALALGQHPYEGVYFGAYQGDFDAGRVFVYDGSGGGLSATPTIVDGTQAGASWGHSVASAGDVNGDGFADIIVGEPFWDDGGTVDNGAASAIHGSATGLSPTIAWTTVGFLNTGELGYSVSSAGDVNGDGYSDVIVGQPGASTHPGKFGFVSLHNLLAAGYEGAVFATNLEGEPVLGVETVRSIDDIPEGVADLVFVCTPGSAVPDVLRQAAGRGIRARALALVGRGEDEQEAGSPAPEEQR